MFSIDIPCKPLVWSYCLSIGYTKVSESRRCDSGVFRGVVVGLAVLSHFSTEFRCTTWCIILHNRIQIMQGPSSLHPKPQTLQSPSFQLAQGPTIKFELGSQDSLSRTPGARARTLHPQAKVSISSRSRVLGFGDCGLGGYRP